MALLDGEAKELRDSIRDAMRRESTLKVVRRADADNQVWPSLWALAVDLGWTAIGIPETLGGLGLNLASQVLAAEEAGYSLFPAPLVSTTQAVAALSAQPPSDARDAALAAIADGAVASIATDGTHRTATTTLAHVADGDRVQWVVALGLEPGGWRTLAYVTGGARYDDGPGPDRTRPVWTLTLDRAGGTEVGAAVSVALRRARVVAAAELVGIATRALDVAVQHARERRQFGRAIGEFQGVKHRLANDYVAVERARSLVLASCSADAEADEDGAEQLSRMAKAAAGDAAMIGARDAIQVLGAIGITAECALPWLLRRARVGAQQLGDARQHYAWLGQRTLAAAR